MASPGTKRITVDFHFGTVNGVTLFKINMYDLECTNLLQVQTHFFIVEDNEVKLEGVSNGKQLLPYCAESAQLHTQ